MDWEQIDTNVYTADLNMTAGESETIAITGGRHIQIAIVPGSGAIAHVEHTNQNIADAEWFDSGFGDITEKKYIYNIPKITGVKLSVTAGSVDFHLMLRK